MPRRKLPPIHPGEVLREEFLAPLGITQYRLAKDVSVPPRRINEIVRGSRAITADTALRLARYFGTTPGFWMNLQSRYELDVALRESGKDIRCRFVADAVAALLAGKAVPRAQTDVYGCLIPQPK